MERLRAADILCAKVADYGDMRGPGFPVNSAEAAQQSYRPVPDKGEHSRTLLREMGFSEAETDEMVASGAAVSS
ncbi:hypothetical protein [Pseudomonas monteilii]|uniref:CoA transferase n=1 Tax=Pseudomonas monteilii TaxID=76759 RepID=A0A399M6G2_9PSED|nr:hypothetical protein [Pseudomonas monteilii]RII77368.1 hypothetical protein D0894_12210 [Pseudomonas monteilii]